MLKCKEKHNWCSSYDNYFVQTDEITEINLRSILETNIHEQHARIIEPLLRLIKHSGVLVTRTKKVGVSKKAKVKKYNKGLLFRLRKDAHKRTNDIANLREILHGYATYQTYPDPTKGKFLSLMVGDGLQIALGVLSKTVTFSMGFHRAKGDVILLHE
jgi:hypothetical protein